MRCCRLTKKEVERDVAMEIIGTSIVESIARP